MAHPGLSQAQRDAILQASGLPPAPQQTAAPATMSAAAPQLNFDLKVSDMLPETQQLVAQVARQMGVAVPFGVINGVIVNGMGEPIRGAGTPEQYGQLVEGLRSGGIELGQIRPGGIVAAPSTQPQAPAPALPPTGLVGAEQALQGGAESALTALEAATNVGREDVQAATESALSTLTQGSQQNIDITDTINQAVQAALAGGRAQTLETATATDQSVQDALTGGRAQTIGTALGFQGLAEQQLSPFMSTGLRATGLQAALAGALGPGAQASAFRNFMESPEQQFIRDRGEQAVLRNAAAIGGLGGGNVRKELTEFGTGLAAQDFNNMFNRLGIVAQQGLPAAQSLTGITGQLGGQVLGELGQSQRTGAGITSQLGGQVLGELGQSQRTGASLAGGLGTNLLGLLSGSQQQQAGIQQQAGSDLASLVQGGGNLAANILFNTGQQAAQNRFTTGTMLADELSGASNTLAGIQNQQGVNLTNLLGATGGDLSALLSGTGQQLGMSQQQLAALLANIATGSATQTAGLPGIPGVQGGGNVLQGAGQLTDAITGALGL